ncbi:MAG: RIP metalloprotease RseP [Bacteroidales bacterium]|jgi:regulator of sigma E protease|nr:RIP metalloprotease RseP [Bacteroidales bacterium]
MVALVKTLQVILALSLLIIVHELGHFLWARIFGIKVDKFYLFFDAGGKALARWHWGGTEFGIGWIPFGGYCKIAGMIDESMDLEQMKKEPQEWEFRSKPAWKRLFVMAGGVVNNFIFAVLVYIIIAGIWGEAYISNENAQIAPNELAQEMGFKLGDHIISFDGYEPQNFGMLQADLARRDVRSAKILRGTDTLDLYIDQAYIGEVLNSAGMFDLAVPFVVDSMRFDSGNASCGLVSGDRVTAFNGREISFIQDARGVLADYKGSTVTATVLRGSETFEVPVQVDSLGQIGVYLRLPQIERRQYTVLEAIPAGIRLTGETMGGYVRDLGLLFRPSTGAYKSVGSFIAIGQVFPSVWDWFRFLNILALLSVMLGIMNLLPIPALDGGHILITLFEMFTGRKPSDRFLVVTQMIGMVLLLALMVLAFGNDIGRLIH